MTESVVLDGVSLLPIKQAAARVSYTRDYVARLAREQKIVATRIGRQWYVDPVSLSSFVAQAEVEQSIRRKMLQHERQVERELAQHVAATKTVHTIRAKQAPQRALVFSLAMLACAVLGGVSMVELEDEWSSRVALQLADSRALHSVVPVATNPAPAIKSPTPSPTPAETLMVEPDVVSVAPLLPEDALGILLIAETGPVRTAEDINALFSDPVTFVRRADGQTEVRLAAGAATTSAPILMVPLAAAPVTTTTSE